MIRNWLKKMINHGQVEYIGTKVLKWFGMEESKSITTPFEVNVQLSMEQVLGSKKETIEMGNMPPEATSGSIIYAMIATRPNIVATIRIVGQCMQNPIYTHYKAMRWIMKYLQGTHNYWLQFTRIWENNEVIFMSYYDMNWGVDLKTKKSTTKYVFLPGPTTISWNNKWQPIMVLSTCQATK